MQMNPQQTDPAQTDEKGSISYALSQFEAQLSRPDAASLQLLMYHGDPGSGKSARLTEMQERCDTLEVPWVLADFSTFSAETNKLTSLHTTIAMLSEIGKETTSKPIRSGLEKIHADSKKLDQHKNVLGWSDGAATAFNTVQFWDAILKGDVHAIIFSGINFAVYNHKTVSTTLRNTLDELQHTRKLKKLSQEELQAEIDKDYLARFVSSFSAGVQSEHPIKAVLFFSAYDLSPKNEGYDWLYEAYKVLHHYGFLFVVSGQHETAGWPDKDVFNIPLYGFTEDEARAYLDQVAQTQQENYHLLERMPQEIAEKLLKKCKESRRHGRNYYHPLSLKGWADVLRLGLDEDKQYSTDLVARLDAPQVGNRDEHLLNQTIEAIPSEYRGIKTWLYDMALAPLFDKEFAIAVNRSNPTRTHSMSPEIDWTYLSRLKILNKHEVKYDSEEHTFYKLPRIYQQIFAKKLESKEKQQIHRIGVEHWLGRAEKALSENEYDLYQMEEPYWRSLMSNGLFHLSKLEKPSNKRKKPVTDKATLSITKLLLDFYWWWCENLPHEDWHEMFEMIEAVTHDRQSNISKTLEQFKAFDAAWPKRWQLNPQNWKPDAEKTDEEKKWNYSVVLASMETLRKISAAGDKNAQEGTDAKDLSHLSEYLDAMISYYEGLAHHYGALSPSLNPDATFKRSEVALKKYGEYGGFKPESHAQLKKAWSLIALADLYTDMKTYELADSCANEALGLISEIEDQTGVHREGASSAYHVLSAGALRQGDWKNAGEMMGQAMVHSFGFYAADHDEYSYTYHHDYQRRCVADDLKTAPPSEALHYLQGFQRQWRGTGSKLGETATVQECVEACFQAILPLPALPDGKLDKISLESFEEAEAEFQLLLGRLSSPIKPS